MFGLFGVQPKKIKLYLIARISKDAHEWNEMVCSYFRDPIEVFIPHQHNPYNLAHEKIPQPVVNTDMNAMNEAHIGFALPEFRNDCAFETGWFVGQNKPLVYFVDDQLQWLRDWMIKGNLTAVITNNPDTYDKLKADEIIHGKKIILIKEMAELNNIIQKIYQEKYA